MTITYDNQNYFAPDPYFCPFCHAKVTPELLNYYSIKADNTQQQYITIWQCNNRQDDCEKVFVANYNLVYHKPTSANVTESQGVITRGGSTTRIVAASMGKNVLELAGFLNGFPNAPVWPKPVLELKSGLSLGEENPQPSKFKKIYMQSLEAESKGLDEIAGMGFRKAIEFLIKDLAISKETDAEKRNDIIEKLWLKQVIDNYFKDPIKSVIERGAWLGNDHSHYRRVFEDFDLDTLKEIIALILADLERDYQINLLTTSIDKRK